MTREDVLKAAHDCVCGDRERDYGSPDGSFSLIAKFWSVWLGVEISSKDVAMMMCLLKTARIKSSDKPDSYVDLAGYAACCGEIGTIKNCFNPSYDYNMSYSPNSANMQDHGRHALADI